MLRESDGTEDNPYSFPVRKGMIQKHLKEFDGKYEIIDVPNITHITYGRDVGYTIEEEQLPEEVEKISATDIRNAELR
tara:strand:- start:276 stop:509 length:234 start_codon:yes stop_codon:yes gene_type:complete